MRRLGALVRRHGSAVRALPDEDGRACVRGRAIRFRRRRFRHAQTHLAAHRASARGGPKHRDESCRRRPRSPRSRPQRRSRSRLPSSHRRLPRPRSPFRRKRPPRRCPRCRRNISRRRCRRSISRRRCRRSTSRPRRRASMHMKCRARSRSRVPRRSRFSTQVKLSKPAAFAQPKTKYRERSRVHGRANRHPAYGNTSHGNSRNRPPAHRRAGR